MVSDSDSPLRWVRPDFAKLAAYTPGEQVTDCIKLNTNESVHPPSPTVAEALRSYAVAYLRRYPQPLATTLCETAATHYGISPDMVLAGNGSDDCLTILYRSHLLPGDRVACPWPTYSLYDNLAGLQGATMIHVPWRGTGAERWQLPTEELAGSGAKLVLIANPNNPSATLVPPAELSRLAGALPGILVVDEAYIDYAPAGSSCLPLLRQHRNLVVLRTFSKSYSLAGARLGLLFAAPELVQEYRKAKDSYNVNALTQTLGIAALGDRGHHRQLVTDTLAQRLRLEQALAHYGWTWPASAANFVLCRVGPRAGEIYRALKSRGILVRWWDRPDLREHLRITVGAAHENGALLAALAEIV